MNHKPHISEAKKAQVAHMKKLIVDYPVIGIVDLMNLPSIQLQRMKDSLKGNVELFMSKGRLIKIALEQSSESKKGIENLKDHIKGMPALICTKDNAFKLAKTLQKSKSMAPAKAGQTAPNDIIVPAGPTPFAPGPIIGELGSAGIKAGIDGGKVVIKEDSKILSEGDIISGEVAALLTRLSIEPMEVGLNLSGAYEEGHIFTKDVLFIDEQEYIGKITSAAIESFNLAFNAAYPTSETTKLLITKAFKDATALADSQDIMTSENASKILAKANMQMESLKKKLPNLENVKVEEKKEESSKQVEEIVPVQSETPKEKELLAEKIEDEIKETNEEIKEIVEDIKEDNIPQESTEAPVELTDVEDNKPQEINKVKSKEDTFKEEEQAAQDVLKKLQDEKMGKNKT